MSFKINLFTFAKDSNSTKQPTGTGTELNCNILTPADITAPVVEIAASDPTAYNYAYISDFGRYYYITGIESVRTGLVRVYMHVDVLKSFDSAIRANNALIDKQNTAGNVYLNDGTWKHEAREFYTIETFPNGFNDSGEYILITAGA